MKKVIAILFLALGGVLQAQSIMDVVIDQSNWEVCPDQVVDVLAQRTQVQNNALGMNGTNQYLEIPNDPAMNIGTGDITIEFWFQSFTSNTTEYLAVYRDAGSVGWAVIKTNFGYIGFAARDGNGAFDFSFANTTKVDDANWHHVAISWNRTSGTMDMYVDGSFETAKVLNVSGDISHNSAIMLGYGVSPTSGNPVYLNGGMDEFRIWNEARSSGDIQTFMSTHLNPASFSTLAVNFDFNEVTSANGWYDCAAGITAPNSTAAPSIDLGGGPFTNFNFAYTWTNTSGNTQNGATYQKTFNQNDTVIVTAGYCKYAATDTLFVTVLDCDTLRDPRDVAAVFAPTAFTPNGDTRNDFYDVKANAISYYDMTIYNRLGNILFHTRDINTGWNGKFNDELCREGVYVAKIIYRDVDGVEFVKYQQFTLMR
ncbi:MAG: hypothetical protein RL754_159 [Bacteroidota bacterium]|jgi:gliding motility-associated-like protein